LTHSADNCDVTFLRFAICALLAITQLSAGDLQSDVQKIVNAASLHKGHAGVYIIDTKTGKPIVQINASELMIPASNQKLLITGAALHVLGPDFAFKTHLMLDGENLTLIGDGDPTIGDSELLKISDWSNENDFLDSELMPWVQAVKKAGVNEIKTLYVDDRIFDRNFIHPSWPANQINNWYCAQVSGLNYHLNVVHFLPKPRSGTTASLGAITPRMNWISFGNKTSSNVGKKQKSSFWVARAPNTNKMTARGNVNSKHTVPVKIAFHDAAIVFGKTLANLIRKNGIQVGSVERISDDAPPLKGTILFTRSTPIQSALTRSNTDSYNLYAESLLKRISAEATGRSGTFDEGAEVVKKVLSQRLNESGRSTIVADGSGMSRNNRISPAILARWLASFDTNEPVGKALIDSLATPGNGTLKNRFTNTSLGKATVHAKSGYILGVCALSGYITFQNREPIVFSILVNDVKGTVRGAKTMQEKIIAAVIQATSSTVGK
jgi:D-alanyl-D-alanine carboxypeptidase/D-alanyl-D-alanine-endopeptidase (penicillin-binding protein 4)